MPNNQEFPTAGIHSLHNANVINRQQLVTPHFHSLNLNLNHGYVTGKSFVIAEQT